MVLYLWKVVVSVQIRVLGDEVEGGSELEPNVSTSDGNVARAMAVHDDASSNLTNVDEDTKPKPRPFVSHIKPPTVRESKKSANCRFKNGIGDYI